jgi:hypothetical protein
MRGNVSFDIERGVFSRDVAFDYAVMSPSETNTIDVMTERLITQLHEEIQRNIL